MKEHKADYYFKWSLRVYICVSVCMYLCCVVARALPDICLSRWACCWIQPSALCILLPTASELHLQAHVWSQDSEIWAQDNTSFIKHIKKDVFSIQHTWCMFVRFGKVGEPAGSEDPVTVRSSFCQYFNCCREEVKCILCSTFQTSTSRKLQPVQHSTALHCPL